MTDRNTAAEKQSPTGVGGAGPNALASGAAHPQYTTSPPPMQALEAWALTYVRRGWHVLPLRYRDKRPLGRLVPHGEKDATRDEGQVRAWWREYPQANIGIALRGDLLVIDVDPRHDGEESLSALVARYGPLPETRICRTGGGGRHLYFRRPESANHWRNVVLAPGVEVKVNGYIVAPPSVHPSGNRYVWENNEQPADPPDWLFNLIQQQQQTRERKEQIPEGERNTTLTRIAGRLRAKGKDEEAILRELRKVNAARCVPPLPDSELQKIARSMMRYTPTEAARESGGQFVSAKELAPYFRGRFRWAEHRGTWMEWQGVVWRPVNDGKVACFAAETLAELYATEERLLRCAHSYAYIRGVLAFLRGMEGILTDAEKWDADPWLLNVLNGTIDLRTSELRPHNPDDLLTRLAPVHYDPNASAPRWNAHLERFLPDAEVRRQIQRDLGVALVGATLQETLPIWHGDGANGKSTTARVLMMVLGDYAKRTAPDLLVEKNHDRHPTEVADLAGVRLAFTVEVDEGKKLAEALVKDLTGGDRKKARFMRQDFFEFEQTFTIVMVANHRPEVRGQDNAIWRRIRLIPWTYRIPEAEARPQEEVVEELKAEGSGILNWLLEGLRDWQKDRLWTAPAVVAATTAYREEQDVLGGFLADCCELAPRATTAARDLYNAYTAWCERTGEEPVTKTRMGKLLRARGLTATRAPGGERQWQGVRLKNL